MKNSLFLLAFFSYLTACTDTKLKPNNVYTECLVKIDSLCMIQTAFSLDSSYVANDDIGLRGWEMDKVLLFESPCDTVTIYFYIDEIKEQRARQITDSMLCKNLVSKLDDEYHGKLMKLSTPKTFFDKGIYAEYVTNKKKIIQFSGILYSVCKKVLIVAIESESKIGVEEATVRKNFDVLLKSLSIECVEKK